MNEKTRNQINEMKKQTIGVEIEMNNITRQKAAKIAATFFGTGRVEYTANRNGYMTWSAWDAQGREWKFSRDVSISGPDDEKCEMVTPILTYADIESLQELCRQLRRAGAKSDATRGCGVHIHIGAKGHTPQTLRNLANIMASHESLLAEALKLDRSRMNRYCRTVDPNFLREVNRKKPTSMARLADIALAVGKQGGIAVLNLQPGNCLRLLDPTIVFLQIHAYRLLEICQADLPVAVSIHSVPQVQGFCPIFVTFLALIIPQMARYVLRRKAFSIVQ